MALGTSPAARIDVCSRRHCPMAGLLGTQAKAPHSFPRGCGSLCVTSMACRAGGGKKVKEPRLWVPVPLYGGAARFEPGRSMRTSAALAYPGQFGWDTLGRGSAYWRERAWHWDACYPEL